MGDPLVETPWNTRMDPDEMEDYYERTLAALERECKRDDCDETTEFPRRYCGHVCENKAMREAADKLEALMKARGAIPDE